MKRYLIAGLGFLEYLLCITIENHCLCLDTRAHMACGSFIPVADLSKAALLSLGFLPCKSARVYHFSLPRHFHHWDRCLYEDRERTTAAIRRGVTPFLKGYSCTPRGPGAQGDRFFLIRGFLFHSWTSLPESKDEQTSRCLYTFKKRGENLTPPQ